MDLEPARPEDKLELSMDDKLARAGGFGLCQWLTSSTAFCAWVVHGAQVMSMAYIGPAAAVEFAEDATLVRLNGSLFFLGWLFGVGIWGQLAARHGWLRALGCVEVLVVVAGCAGARASSGRAFVTWRFVCGFAEGAVPTTTFGWAAEFLHVSRLKARVGILLQASGRRALITTVSLTASLCHAAPPPPPRASPRSDGVHPRLPAGGPRQRAARPGALAAAHARRLAARRAARTVQSVPARVAALAAAGGARGESARGPARRGPPQRPPAAAAARAAQARSLLLLLLRRRRRRHRRRHRRRLVRPEQSQDARALLARPLVEARRPLPRARPPLHTPAPRPPRALRQRRLYPWGLGRRRPAALPPAA